MFWIAPVARDNDKCSGSLLLPTTTTSVLAHSCCPQQRQVFWIAPVAHKCPGTLLLPAASVLARSCCPQEQVYRLVPVACNKSPGSLLLPTRTSAQARSCSTPKRQVPWLAPVPPRQRQVPWLAPVPPRQRQVPWLAPVPPKQQVHSSLLFPKTTTSALARSARHVAGSSRPRRE